MFRLLTEEESSAKETDRKIGDRKIEGKPEKGKSTQQSFFQVGHTVLLAPSLHAGRCSPSRWMLGTVVPSLDAGGFIMVMRVL